MNTSNRSKRGCASVAEIRRLRLEHHPAFEGAEVFPASEVAKFLSRLVRLPSGCIEYRGKRSRKLKALYPRFSWLNEAGERRWTSVHRIGALLNEGSHPYGRLVCHDCLSRHCVMHVRFGTPSENQRDRRRLERTIARTGRAVVTIPMRRRTFACEAVAA